MPISCEEYRYQQQLLVLKKRLAEDKLSSEEQEEIEKLVQELEMKYPAAELRGIQFSKKLSSLLSKIPLNYGGDGGGLRWPPAQRASGSERGDHKIISPSP